MSPSRFDYVRYDQIAISKQERFKTLVSGLESALNDELRSSPGGRDPYGRAKALVLTKLEEVYMWIGKAIRDEQLARSDGVAELQEERKDG